MSKKIKINIPDKKKPNLISLFHKYLLRKTEESDYAYEMPIWDYSDEEDYWNKTFPGWDDDDDDVTVFPPSTSKSRKGKRVDRNIYEYYRQLRREESWKKGKHKHTKGKKAKLFDINTPYSGYEENPDEYDFDDINITDDYESDVKEIWFYPDFHCKEDKLQFYCFKDFSDYCNGMGYWIDPEVAADIEWRYESHCCLNPESEKCGLLEIMTEHSYGELFYEACEEDDLSD